MYLDYNKKKILILGAIQADISSAGWEVEKATFLVVENNRCLLGMDLKPKLGNLHTSITEEQCVRNQ